METNNDARAVSLAREHGFGWCTGPGGRRPHAVDLAHADRFGRPPQRQRAFCGAYLTAIWYAPNPGEIVTPCRACVRWILHTYGPETPLTPSNAGYGSLTYRVHPRRSYAFRSAIVGILALALAARAHQAVARPVYTGSIDPSERALVERTLAAVAYMGVASVDFRPVEELDNRRNGSDPYAVAEAGYQGPAAGAVHIGTLDGSMRALYAAEGGGTLDESLELVVVHEACHVYLRSPEHGATHTGCMRAGLSRLGSAWIVDASR